MKKVYLDNAATTYPKPKEVYDSIDHYNRNFMGSVNRTVMNNNIDYVTEVRKLLLKLVNGSRDYKAIIQPSATIAMNTVLQGLDWSGVENVYLTHFEHNATIRTVHYLSQKYNFEISYLEMNDNCKRYDLSMIKAQFNNKNPDVLIMTHASNAFGLITPIAEINNLVNDQTYVIVDGAQTTGLLELNLDNSKIDAFIFAGHKTLYGPFGIGGFIVRDINRINPLYYGGTGVDSSEIKMPNDETKFEAGSVNMLSLIGLYNSLLKLNQKEIYEHEMVIKEKLLSILQKYDYININEFENQIGVVSVTSDQISTDEFAHLLSTNDIIVRSGLHCAPDAHKKIGTYPAGTIRFSISQFTNEDDLEYLNSVLEEIEFEI